MRMLIVVLTLAVQLLLVPSPGHASTPSPPGAGQERAVAERGGGSWRQLTKGYACKKVRNDSYNNQISTCANVTWKRSSIDMNGPLSVRMRNRTANKQTLVCKWEESKSWSFSASVSSEIEAGVIFTKAKVSVSASASYTKTVNVGTSVSVTVSPRSDGWCLSGMSRPSYGGYIRDIKCGPSGYCEWMTSRTYRARVPDQFVWDIREKPLR